MRRVRYAWVNKIGKTSAGTSLIKPWKRLTLVFVKSGLLICALILKLAIDWGKTTIQVFVWWHEKTVRTKAGSRKQSALHKGVRYWVMESRPTRKSDRKTGMPLRQSSSFIVADCDITTALSPWIMEKRACPTCCSILLNNRCRQPERNLALVQE